jgi:hypothetical protein
MYMYMCQDENIHVYMYVDVLNRSWIKTHERSFLKFTMTMYAKQPQQSPNRDWAWSIQVLIDLSGASLHLRNW